MYLSMQKLTTAPVDWVKNSGMRAPRIVYISCNPATFARDAASLRKEGYRLGRVTPFDMFPHTMHTELVARFEKKG